MTGPRLVMIEGVAPGIGKSTLAASLARVLRAGGSPVDLFPEEDLFTRPEFAEVAQGFRTKDFPTPEHFLPAYAATFEAQRAGNAWGIFDWNCAGMASDLPWAASDPARLRTLVRDVRLLAEERTPLVVSLRGDVRQATRRAAAERGRGWVDYWARIADEHGVSEGPAFERIVHYQESVQVLKQADLDILRTTGWQVVDLDASASADEVLGQALTALRLPVTS
ncbi:hypothetical protein ABZV93_23990 [Actinopolymorpha sp. NPDC004070]|uniref:hypothetical protein n=1 Tax=Actinopolymorpha sp. NPDC004070 TaxID=3154548 RepID=UPI0033A33D0E